MTFNKAMEKAGVNMDETLRRFGGNCALLERFMRQFSADPTVAELHKAASAWSEASHAGNPAGDPASNPASMDDILRAAHTLKGTSGNLGLTALYTCSSAIVDACRAGQHEKLPQLLDGLFCEHALIMDVLGQIDLA